MAASVCKARRQNQILGGNGGRTQLMAQMFPELSIQRRWNRNSVFCSMMYEATEAILDINFFQRYHKDQLRASDSGRKAPQITGG